MINKTIPLTLNEIADWSLSSRNKINHNATWATIPSFQRGLVWNPAQIEVLWDSLMRGIPIGALSLLPFVGNERFQRGGNDVANLNGSYWLVDGQQRANAIALGYKPFPKCNSNESILWLDLLPDRSKRTKRKFFFYLTTPGRPWGYRPVESDDEKKFEKVPTDEYRYVLRHEIQWTRKNGSKPPTSLLWPIMANLPVPFSIMWELFKSQGHLAIEEICNFAKADNATWAKHFQKRIEKHYDEQCFCSKIKTELGAIEEGLHRVRDTRTIGLIVPGCLSGDETDNQEADDNSAIAVYFSRLNKGGSTPDREDLDYSILKTVVPKLSVIDHFAEQLMHPSRLANIAVLTFLSRKEWKETLSRADIFKLQDDEKFEQFIGDTNNSEFKNAIDTVVGWLVFCPDNQLGLPRVVFSSIAKNAPRLIRFLILFALLKKRTARCIENNTIIAFVTILNWFGEDKTLDFQLLYKRLQEERANDDIEVLCKWLGTQIECKTIAIPPRLEELKCIRDLAHDNNVEKLKKAWNPTGYSEGLAKVWDWKTSSGRCFLLYACRRFLDATFSNYDPASAIWKEDDRPWDYDHVIPRSWLQQGKGKKRGEFHDVVEKFLMSIGNIAPVPFSINRSKQDEPPCDYLGSDNERVFVDFHGPNGAEPDFVHEKPKKKLETDKKAACIFAFITTVRWIQLLTEWYELPIHQLLARSVDDNRKKIIKDIQDFFTAKGFSPETVYLWNDGKQYRINDSDDLDFTRPWIACGISATFYRDDNSQESCFLSVCIQKKKDNTTFELKDKLEVGLRRHPDSSMRLKDNEWWTGDDSKYMETDSTCEAIGFLEKLLTCSQIKPITISNNNTK